VEGTNGLKNRETEERTGKKPCDGEAGDSKALINVIEDRTTSLTDRRGKEGAGRNRVAGVVSAPLATGSGKKDNKKD